MLKVIVIGVIAYLVLAPQYKYAAVTVDMNIANIMETAKTLAIRLLIGGIPALAALAAYFFLRPYSLRGERLRRVHAQVAARHAATPTE